MLKKAELLRTLTELDAKFNSASSSREQLFFAKLTVIETCGWIEESIDQILFKFIARKILDPQITRVATDTIKNNFGFSYEKNLKSKILIPLLGWSNVDLLEAKLDATKFLNLKSSLGNLKVSRDSLSHTYIKNRTFTINAPTTTITHFNYVHDGLTDFEKKLLKVKFKI